MGRQVYCPVPVFFYVRLTAVLIHLDLGLERIGQRCSMPGNVPIGQVPYTQHAGSLETRWSPEQTCPVPSGDFSRFNLWDRRPALGNAKEGTVPMPSALPGLAGKWVCRQQTAQARGYLGTCLERCHIHAEIIKVMIIIYPTPATCLAASQAIHTHMANHQRR